MRISILVIILKYFHMDETFKVEARSQLGKDPKEIMSVLEIFIARCNKSFGYGKQIRTKECQRITFSGKKVISPSPPKAWGAKK